MKVVLDVNVWVSALLWRGTPGKIVDLVDNLNEFEGIPIMTQSRFSQSLFSGTLKQFY